MKRQAFVCLLVSVSLLEFKLYENRDFIVCTTVCSCLEQLELKKKTKKKTVESIGWMNGWKEGGMK